MVEVGEPARLYLFDVSKPGAKPRAITNCSVGTGFSCGDGNPSFAPEIRVAAK
jgi:hypothetical protein